MVTQLLSKCCALFCLLVSMLLPLKHSPRGLVLAHPHHMPPAQRQSVSRQIACEGGAVRNKGINWLAIS
jgi:hypothetical protein